MKPVAAKAIVIGGSAGSVDAMSTILRALPANYAVPVITVIHIPPDSKSLLPEILQTHCKLTVHEIEDKMPAIAGVYIAPPNYHVLPEKDGTLSLSTEDEVLFSRPSIDVLFETAADAFGKLLVGVVITGANEDGSKGLRRIVEAGGTALIQDPGTAYAPMMPRAAEKLCPDAPLMTLKQIGDFLAETVIPCP